MNKVDRDVNFYHPEDLRSPLGRSSLENSGFCQTKEEKRSSTAKHKKEAIESHSYHHHQRTTQYFRDEARSSAADQYGNDYGSSKQNTRQQEEYYNQVKRLETKLKESLQEKQALERICAQLEKENAELKKEAREAGRKARQSQWTDQDEKEFLASRRIRREAQSLIKAPIQEHLEKVNYIYEIKNQWCMTNKTHFSLQFPEQFQRAPALDIRDKERKEAAKKAQENGEASQHLESNSEDGGAIKGTRLSYDIPKPRSSLASMHRPIIKSPPGLAILKKLTTK